MQNNEKFTEESLDERLNVKLAELVKKEREEWEQILFTKREFACLCSLSLRQVERLVEADHIRPVKRRPMEFNIEGFHEYLDYLEARAMGILR